MSNAQVLFRRGTTAQNDNYVGPLASITIDTTLNQIRLHDGVTIGGHPIASEADLQAAIDAIDGLSISNITGLQDALDSLQNNKLETSLKGAANGLAELDAGGKVPLSQINDAILGQVEYKGTWNAATNSPTLPTTPEKKGDYYVVNTGGTRFSLTFDVGDWIISDGTKWDKVDNTDAVTSVAGRMGAVVLTKDDVGLGNVDNVQQAPATRTLTAGDGLTGGGNLTDNRTFTLGTPSTITSSTTNSVSTTSHTHALTVTKGDVGLGSVQNYAIATEAENIAGTTNVKYATPKSIRDFVEDGEYIIDCGTF